MQDADIVQIEEKKESGKKLKEELRKLLNSEDYKNLQDTDKMTDKLIQRLG